MNSQRIPYIDYVKALAMILVIMGHVNFANEDIKAWIYSFHMPVFFFCTGLVLKNSGKGIKQGVVKYARRLMVPYFLWALLFAHFTIPNWVMILYGSHQSLAKAGSLTSLWFLPVMFLAVCLFFFVRNKINKNEAKWLDILLVVLIITIGFIMPKLRIGYPWVANVVLVAFPILLVGNIMKHCIHSFYQYAKQHKVIGIVLCILLTIGFYFGTLTYQYNDSDFKYVLMAEARYGSIFCFVLTTICGIMMLLSVSMLFDILFKPNVIIAKWLSFVGQNTLCIFAVQKPIINCFKSLYQIFNIDNNVTELAITTLGTLLTSCALGLLINKYVPVIVGKN